MSRTLVYLVCCVLSSVLAQPEVVIDSGIVQGRRVNTNINDADKSQFVNSFYGIPFAKAPVGDLRFAEPEPVDPWDGTFLATSLSTACMQSTRGWLWLTHPGWNNYDEDCLNLNVFTPSDMNPDEPYAVMIFFHGGGYVSGGNIQYPGHFLAARNVILVVPNYRLGIFGYISTNDDAAPGNYGMYDQNLAMDWVQRNIAAFGGDPNRVTLFGQSAGASSSSLHIVSPKSQGMFNQIIGQSGTDMNFWTLNYPNSEPEDYTRQVADKLECPTDDTYAMVDCLREVDQGRLYNNSGFSCTPGHFCQGFAPVVDGEGGFVPDYPYLLRERGEFAQDVNIFSGYNTEDGSLYTVFMIPESMEGGFTRDEWLYHLDTSLLFFWEPQLDEITYQNVFEATSFFYTPWPTLEDKELNRAVFNDLITDAAFGYTCEKQLVLQSATSANNYQYLFGYRSNATLEGEGFWNGTEWVGVPHSGEVPYVFGWSLMHTAPAVRLDSRILIDIMDYNDEDVQYANFVIDLWTNFAKYGNPTPEPITPPIGNAPLQLERFTENARNILIIGRDVYQSINHRSRENAFFAEYMSYIIGKPLAARGTQSSMSYSGRKPFDNAAFNGNRDEMVERLLKKRFPKKFDDLFDEEK